jgi:hypothetical protein
MNQGPPGVFAPEGLCCFNRFDQALLAGLVRRFRLRRLRLGFRYSGFRFTFRGMSTVRHNTSSTQKNEQSVCSEPREATITSVSLSANINE